MKHNASIIEQAFKLAVEHNDISYAKYFAEHLAKLVNGSYKIPADVRNKAKHYVLSRTKI